MKILLTSEYYAPSVGGSQEVVKQLAERLARRGHRVTVATTRLPQRRAGEINGVRIAEFPIRGNRAFGFDGPVEDYQRFLLDGDFDVVLNYAAQQWTTDLVLPLLGRLPYPALLAPCGFSGLRHAAYAAYFAELPEVLRQYKRLIVHSDIYQDAAYLREHGLAYCVITNGAAEDEFSHIDGSFRRRYRIPENAVMLLTVGSHTGTKGHKLAIQAFMRAATGRAVLVIIGNTLNSAGCLPSCCKRALLANLTGFGRKTVRLLNPPRADVVAAYHAADLFLFGSNVECSPLVLFEAMASRTPFISLACGNAAEIAEWGQSGVILPTYPWQNGMVNGDVDDMATAITRLVHNPEERRRLAENGYQAWRERFTWERIAVQYESLLLDAIEQRKEA